MSSRSLVVADGADVVAAAYSWLGTPYQHQASCRHAGCDCLGLVRGVWRVLHGEEPWQVEPYSRDWGEVAGREPLLDAARACLCRVADPMTAHKSAKSRVEIQPGYVLLFRMRPGAMAKHLGIAVTSNTMVHAQEGLAVSEVALSPWWRRRITAIFAFPSAT